MQERTMATNKKSLDQVFGSMPRCRVALEVGTHSPWVNRHLVRQGHEVIVANARRVRLISESTRKNDKLDARCQDTGAPGANRSTVAVAHSAPQRASAGRSDHDPRTGGAGGDANRTDQFGSWAD